jgi:predicted nucleic acid-binding protein
MSHYWFDPVVRTKVDKLAIIGTLCSSMVTMEEARFSARTKKDLTFLTDLYIKTFFWLPFDEETEQNVADIHTALWKIGAGARRTKKQTTSSPPRPFDTMRWLCTTTPTS